MSAYKFEGIIKSELTSDGVAFSIEPISEYRKSITREGRTIDVWFAVAETELDAAVFIEKKSCNLTTNGSDKMTSEAYSWLCAHADTGRVVPFTVDSDGILQYPKRRKKNPKKIRNVKQ